MMSNNKILTVSYGTFSCTLEGFDDSFDTMKAIAEYFRDLAADDRYFGAEPPQPDADMLARIAEREVSRRVEAREHEGKIHLSALAGPAAATADSQTTAPEPVVMEEVPVVRPEESDVPEGTEDLTGAAPTLEEAVDVADQVAEAAETPPVVLAEVMSDTDTTEASVETADQVDLGTVVPLETGFQSEGRPDIIPGQPDADVEAFFDQPSADATDEIEDTYEPVEAEDVTETAETPEPDSIAAKLQRIRAVVAQHEEADEEDDYLEDEHADLAETAQEPTGDLLADARADIEQALEADDEADTLSAKDDDPISRLMRQQNDDAVRTVEDTYTLEDSLIADAPDDTIEEDDADPLTNFFDQEETQANADAVAADDGQDDEISEEAESGLRARVIKVSRSDLDAAIEQGELEEYDGIDEGSSADQPEVGLDDLAPAKTADRALTSEEEDALVQELNELEAERVSGDAQEDDTSSSKVMQDDPDNDMGRLMAETEHLMEEPENATRRDAIAHLRAAVAAKKADTAVTGDDAGPDPDEAYRDDLAEVVRPRRPRGIETRTQRPEGDRPAPLKLVAEQRIDVDEPREAGPVRPRRVAAIDDDDAFAPDAESFAEYAAEMGATKLPQLLEAAAAYMSFVEGREQFSRPQLMSTVRQAGSDDFSREDGLRSFGQLLRAGKIEKIKGGRFTVSDDIGYRPDERAAG